MNLRDKIIYLYYTAKIEKRIVCELLDIQEDVFEEVVLHRERVTEKEISFKEKTKLFLLKEVTDDVNHLIGQTQVFEQRLERIEDTLHMLYKKN